MFLNNLTTPNKEKVRNAVLVELDNIGLRNDIPKKIIKHGRRPDGKGRIFRAPLDRLPVTDVRLKCGTDIAVPEFISEACHCVLKNIDVEGIFRKTGSSARQREIKTMLDMGRVVSLSEHHVIDVAGLLKLFLRELPESLVPTQWHDCFVRCLTFGNQSAPAILLLCLLLPPLHLASLTFLMQVLHEVASHSSENKMDAINLAIILAPTLMPVQIPGRMEKASAATVRLNNHVQIIEILIKHAHHIGMVPEYVSHPVESTSSSSSLTEETSLRRSLTRSIKKRRRRSASLTRMLNGLRKIVGNRSSLDRSSSEDETPTKDAVPEFSTPCVKPSKKRKAEEISASGLSSKKKREVLQLLPQSCPLADTPFTPARRSCSAVNVDPSPTREQESTSPPKLRKKRFFGGRTTSESDKNAKKSLLSMGGKITKKNKRSDGGKESHGGGFLERSWSAVSNTSNWGRRKLSQLSLLSTSASMSTTINADLDGDNSADLDAGVDLSLSQTALATTPATPASPTSPPVVCLSARQYADIQRRMSDIETRISSEMKQILSAVGSPEPLRAADTAQAVQTVYQRTLEDSERLLDSSADQLARRLGQQLKIRRKSEARVIRSPSARKINTIRKELRRNKSWHMLQNTSAGSHLRRGRPNTVASGLPQNPAPNRQPRPITSTLSTSTSSPALTATPDHNAVGLPTPLATPRRASSFHAVDSVNPFRPPSANKFSSQVDIAKQALLNSADEKWFDAVQHLGRLRPRPMPVIDRRDSVARLRSENAGMVLAKARLFGAATRAHPPAPVNVKVRIEPSEPTQSESASTPRRQCEERLDQAAIRSLRPRPSPPITAELRRVKKHSSFKMDRAGVTHQPVRRNQSVPCHWPDASKEKENRLRKPSPGRNVASPLRDANRLTSTTPAPAIKAPLGTRIPHRVISTPRSGPRTRPTPLRAIAVPASIHSPRHRSPRVAMGARALAVARSRH